MISLTLVFISFSMSTFFLTVPSLAYRLCGKNIFRLVIIACSLWYVLFCNFIGQSTVVQITFVHNMIPFKFGIKNVHDIAVFKEIFIYKEYEWREVSNAEIIIDLGAHIGDTAVYYHTVYPEAKIYAIEPDPVLFERLRDNSKDIKSIIPIHAAISDTSGIGILNVSSQSSLRGSLTNRIGSDSSIEVPTLTLKALYKQYGVLRADLCKFDIEGAEKSMFGGETAIEYANAYIGELHCDLAGIEPEVFLSSFQGFTIDMKPMRRSNRFSIKAKKQ